MDGGDCDNDDKRGRKKNQPPLRSVWTAVSLTPDVKAYSGYYCTRIKTNLSPIDLITLSEYNYL